MRRLVIFAIALAVAGCGDGGPDIPEALASRIAIPSPTRDREIEQLNTQTTEGRQSAIVEAAARVSPAVVSVNVIRRVRQVVRQDFFMMPREVTRQIQGYGSGFIIHRDGLVITNQHVTEGATEIVVTTTDGRDFPATLLGEDPLTDIAVLKIEPANHPVAVLGSSRTLAIGEWVVAFGNPFAYLLGNTEPTVTAGVVSAIGRNLLPSQDQPGIYVGMIQTDAAINPGNSGGPLTNARGEVVGVNSSIFSQTGGSVGIGFAIPIERALRVANELTQYGSVRRAWVGLDVVGQEALRRWKELGGLEITRVIPDSPAADAGLQARDVLVTAGERLVRNFLDWEAVKLDVGPGDSLQVQITRDGQARSAWLVVEPLPSSRAERISVLDIDLISVTPSIQQERSLSRDYGALVVNVSAATAGVTGLQVGDLIWAINRRRVDSADDLDGQLRELAGGGTVRLLLDRSGRTLQSEFRVR